MPTYAIEQKSPSVADTVFVADTASLIGEVILKEETSVWFGAVLRGDNEPLLVGKGTNVQDNCVLHADPGYPLTIGEHVTVGHLAMLHGCTIQDNCLIGMHTTVLNGAFIDEETIVGAGSLVTENKTFPPGVLVLGSPARVVRELTAEERQAIRASARTYIEKKTRYTGSLKRY